MKTKRVACFSARLAAAVFLTTPLWADDFSATTAPVGRNGDLLVTPANQIVTPASTQVELPGIRPNALALSPDGKLLVTAGLTHELVAINPATGQVLQHVALPSGKVREPQPLTDAILGADEKAQLSFTGLKFSPDGTRLYFANVSGDVKVFAVSREHEVSPLFSIALPPANAPDRENEIPAGLAVSADGKKIYVALNLSNRVAELDAATGKVLRLWDVGVAPFDLVLFTTKSYVRSATRGAGKSSAGTVALGNNKIYVSNWGGRRPDADSLTGPAGRGTLVRVDDRSIASEGSVSVIDLNNNLATPEIITGLHACALALSPNGIFLVVANAGSDTLSVMDTRTDKIVETIFTRQNPGDPFGAQPDALAFDKAGGILYVCNGSQNAVAVVQFQPGTSKLLGLIPAGWFPGAIALAARDKKICVANIKDIGTTVQKAKAEVPGFGYNTRQFFGSLSLIPVPTKPELAAFTQQALADLRYPLLAQAKLPARPERAPQPVPERAGEPSVFRHVIYIIKENRTYDQVLGDVNKGNGDASLCNFGERVTPNEHKLVREFALLDNTYCSGILSADGHQWADSGIATEYVERSFAGWPRSYPAGGDAKSGADALAYSPAGFIWNNALAHGKSVHDFGEFTATSKRWKNPEQEGKISFAEAWADFTSGTNAIEYTCEPDIEALRPFIEKDWVSWDLNVPDVLRAAKFIQRLNEFEEADNLPALTILWLPNDHTSGTKAGSPKPAAQVADNDLALGQIVEAVSRSKFWKDTCIFAIEDDPQNGWDHVSGYRTTAYVVSAYTKRHAVVSTQYNQTSLLRTMELMLGLPPMNQFDATATPMFDCFTNTPDFTAFSAVTNNVPLDEMNPPAKKIYDSQIRKDAFVSTRLPLDKPDQCNEDVLNHILWRATMGAKPYPEWAVKVVDED